MQAEELEEIQEMDQLGNIDDNHEANLGVGNFESQQEMEKLAK
jgi:hypothetical protein